jgi:hypothetical protein
VSGEGIHLVDVDIEDILVRAKNEGKEIEFDPVALKRVIARLIREQ